MGETDNICEPYLCLIYKDPWIHVNIYRIKSNMPPLYITQRVGHRLLDGAMLCGACRL